MNVTLRTYVDVKAVVTIVASMDLHAMGRGYYSRGLLLHIMLYLGGGYYSRRATKQRGCLFEEIRYMRVIIISLVEKYTANRIRE